METEGSSPHPQEPTIYPYPEPDQFSPCPHPTSLRFILILSFHLRLCLPRISLPKVYPPNLPLLLSPIHAICPAHLILIDLMT